MFVLDLCQCNGNISSSWVITFPLNYYEGIRVRGAVVYKASLGSVCFAAVK